MTPLLIVISCAVVILVLYEAIPEVCELALFLHDRGIFSFSSVPVTPYSYFSTICCPKLSIVSAFSLRLNRLNRLIR